MTQYVINWLKNVHPDYSESKINEINKIFDSKYYGMLKNGSSDATANNSAWNWINSVFKVI